MATPATTLTNGSTCTHVQLSSHLSISTTEQNGVNTATEFYIVQWNGKATTEDCRGASDGLVTVPVRSDVHPENSTLNCRRVEIRPIDNNSRTIFQARVEYDDDETTPLNPLNAPPDIQWEVGEDGQIPYFLDNDPAGPKPTVNKAGERFSDYLQRYGGTVTATFAVNIPATGAGSWNPATAINYCAGGINQSNPAINSDTFTFDSIAIPIGQARAKGCTCGSVQIENGVKYRVKKWSLAFKSTWLDVVDNRGFNALVTNGQGNNVLQEIVKGTPPVKPDSPWPLYPSGHAMPNVTDIPNQLTFYPYRQLPFTPLGFS